MGKFLLISASAICFSASAFAQQVWYDPVTGEPVSQTVEPAYPAASQYYESGYTEPTPQTIQPQSGSKLSTDDILFTANVGAVTDYRVRGVSRSDEGPALQASVKAGYAGVYGGVDASTVDLNMDDDAKLEAAFFGGYRTEVGGVDLDGRIVYNTYPGADNEDLDYWEFIGTAGYDFSAFYGTLTWGMSPNYINDSGMTMYYGGDVVAPLPIANYDLTARAHLGFQFIGDDNRYVDDNAMDWLVGLNYKEPTYGVDLGVNWTGTNLDDSDCVEDCGSQLMLSAGKSFGWQ